MGAYVPFTFVNDGVCDYDLCCDGTEEYGKVGGVKCANKCAEIGKEWRRVEKERQDNFDRAFKKRRTMVKESKELRRRIEVRISKLEGEIRDLEQQETELKTKFEEVEQSERGKVVKNEGTGKLGVLLGLAKTRVNELREALAGAIDERRRLQDKVSELEGILSTFKVEYNPNFNDEGVKKAVRAWEDYAAKKTEGVDEETSESDLEEIIKEDGESSGINWNEFEDQAVTDTDICRCSDSSSKKLGTAAILILIPILIPTVYPSRLTQSSIQLRGLSSWAPPGLPPREDQQPPGMVD